MHKTIALSLLLLAPLAAAEEAPFGFEDAPFDALPPVGTSYADLVNGELRVEGDVLRTTLQLVSLPEMTPGVAYIFLFSDGSREWYTAAVTAPTLEYFHGRWAGDESGPDTVDEAKGSYAPGPGGTVTVEMPVKALGNATVLTAPRGLAADIKGQAVPIGLLPVVFVDEAQGQGELRLAPDATATAEPVEPAGAAPAAVADDATPAEPAVAVPAAGAALAALGALVGAFLVGRRGAR